MAETRYFPKNRFSEDFFPLLRNGVLLATGDAHRFQKKILIKAFSKPYLASYVQIFEKHSDLLLTSLQSIVTDDPSGTNVSVMEHTNHFSFNIIGEVAFGYNFD